LLDKIGDFSLIARCFAQPLEDKILVQNIL
jgi:hypothetical protein